MRPQDVDAGQDAPLAAAWKSIRAGLRNDLGARTFDGWIKPAALGRFEPESGALDILMPSQFMADWVKSNFGDRLALAWRHTLPIVREVNLIPVEGAPRPSPMLILEEAPEAPAPRAASAPSAPAHPRPNFDERYDFDHFVVGKANEVAATAARTLANSETVAFNPLFIHGGTGRGKTHLLHAIGQAFLAKHPDALVVSMSAEKFMVEFVRALRENDTIAFKQKLRSADLLLVDDVQFIAGKESTQEEFFHTMNEIITAGRRLVITSDRAPQDLDGIEPRILSRLSWGLVADINAADYELRYNILRAKLDGLAGVEMPEAVVAFLARRITNSIRELEGALNRIAAYAMMTGRVIDVPFVEEVLANVLRANQRRISIDEIQTKVAAHFSIRKAEMTSARRAREVARPRQVAMYLSKQLTPKSLPDIGRRFGGRDHTTVIHAVKRIESLRAADAELDADIRLLQRQLEN
ncbi:chromosomal replication initiator protein DnaA [Sphingomicrobium astaxanthinifaciens]|uniref:chromosomal replication initiator protein DnaA n=1 Tax=Sphingomicrobium astaxanthinifaciens TaxID=1227949 RepID=UPI001FCAE427|nr:chromosomal replication initiator protein DnaA [Sphingomicrobium astaxanthinifaciens]MCJ7422112.1 chromosomal replication initiator protein DnaA [Sphingomicrobium astaxanthinifaciens]